jgi:hypothetical protein
MRKCCLSPPTRYCGYVGIIGAHRYVRGVLVLGLERDGAIVGGRNGLYSTLRARQEEPGLHPHYSNNINYHSHCQHNQRSASRRIDSYIGPQRPRLVPCMI